VAAHSLCAAENVAKIFVSSTLLVKTVRACAVPLPRRK
jgi:hypothetical protein